MRFLGHRAIPVVAAVLAFALTVPPVVLAGLPVAPAATPAPDPAVAGRWDPVLIEGEVPAVSMALLKNGRVLYWSGVEAAHGHDEDMTFFLSHPHEADSRVLDLGGAVAEVLVPLNSTSTKGDLFCSGNTILPSGHVVAAGGTDYTTIPMAGQWDILYGTPDVRYYVPETNEWVPGTDMAHGRWYPSILTLADGDTLAASGIHTLTDPTAMQEAVERFDVGSGTWSTVSEHLLPMYPRLFTIPSGPLKGDLYFSTVSTLWGPFGEHPREGEWSLQQTFDPETGEWTYHAPSLFGARQHGVSVMLPLDAADGYRAEVMSFGGTLQRSIVATPFAEIADLSGETPTTRPAAPMAHGRWHLNGVLLPDGKVLAVGGGVYDNVVIHGQRNVPVLAAELYDPETDAWTTLAAMQVPRMYHSTALLLPDGRVLAGGHVPLPVPFKAARDHLPEWEGQVRETRLEIFEPPYLHRGPRPVIVDAPASVAYGEAFTVRVAAPAGIDSVVLVRPGSTTHAFDADQRVVRLAWTDNGDGTVTAVAPPDGDVAAPGHWMLFVNGAHADGAVPSVARFVELA